MSVLSWPGTKKTRGKDRHQLPGSLAFLLGRGTGGLAGTAGVAGKDWLRRILVVCDL